MPKHAPLTDRQLHQIEALAVDATPGPWEAHTVLDYTTGETSRVVAHVPPGSDQYVSVVEPDGELREEDHAYIAAMHPDAVLDLVREVRRLRRVEDRHTMICSVLEHLNTFLERRGLVREAQRFVEVRAQLERIHPESFPAPAPAAEEPGRAVSLA